MTTYRLVNDTHKTVYVEVVLKKGEPDSWGEYDEIHIGEFFKNDKGEWIADSSRNIGALYSIAFIINMTVDDILDTLQSHTAIIFKLGDIE